jgi:mannose-6-phosphate isomerase-like protein (cupin superfamily)
MFAASMTACDSWPMRGAKGVGLLPAAPPDAAKLSTSQTRNPFAELAPGILTRTLFEASSGRGYRVEVRDLLVGPGKRSASVTLPGAAVFEIRSGPASVSIGDKLEEFRPGSTFVVPEGAAFTVDNRGGTAIAIRVQLFRGE